MDSSGELKGTSHFGLQNPALDLSAQIYGVVTVVTVMVVTMVTDTMVMMWAVETVVVMRILMMMVLR